MDCLTGIPVYNSWWSNLPLCMTWSLSVKVQLNFIGLVFMSCLTFFVCLVWHVTFMQSNTVPGCQGEGLMTKKAKSMLSYKYIVGPLLKRLESTSQNKRKLRRNKNIFILQINFLHTQTEIFKATYTVLNPHYTVTWNNFTSTSKNNFFTEFSSR